MSFGPSVWPYKVRKDGYVLVRKILLTLEGDNVQQKAIFRWQGGIVA